MSITVVWDNEEKTVMRWIFVGRWNWDEFFAGIEQRDQMFEGTSHTIDSIYDLSQSSLLPQNLLSNLNPKSFKKHENSGKTLVIGANAFVQTLANMVRRVYKEWGDSFTMVSTLEEARSELARLRAKNQSSNG